MGDKFPPIMSSPIGRVRKYIPDLILLEDPKDPTAEHSYYLSDEEIEGFLAEYTSSIKPRRWQVKYAAADAIDAIANNEALVLKKIKTEDLETNGAVVANALRAGARELRKRAMEEENSETAFFEIVPFRHPHSQTVLPRRQR